MYSATTSIYSSEEDEETSSSLQKRFSDVRALRGVMCLFLKSVGLLRTNGVSSEHFIEGFLEGEFDVSAFISLMKTIFATSSSGGYKSFIGVIGAEQRTEDQF